MSNKNIRRRKLRFKEKASKQAIKNKRKEKEILKKFFERASTKK